ncbi:MAG: hypothetical protein HY960_00635 [Ignavibacteriae bacterium]|nr:hypothetical protein [Ignavibacteriota bacterium]
MQHLTDREIQELADTKVKNNSFTQANRHLMECRICAERVRAISELSRSIKKIRLEHPSKDFTSQLIRKIGIKEAPSFAWKVLTNFAPLFMLTIVMVVLVGALQISGTTESQEITLAVEKVQTAYSDATKQISTASTALNVWLKKLFPFAFAGDSVTLIIFLVCFLSAIALLDKYLFAHFVKRRQII